MAELDDFAHALEKLTGDPMAESVAGTVTVLSASEPAPRGRFQECALELLAEAPGVDERIVQTAVVTRPQSWPQVGQVLPARVSVSHPGAIDVDWDALGQ
ncbi:hypothetical protein GCM10022200_10180 [Microbacterium awajiense]|uniref:Uncharacterized protein n=1 Tax=Microbacterium awajiense TaxID=415214 RepID=A0ABP7ACZ5_9MICO